MPKRSIDRRVARTRTALHEALLQLMAKKNYDAISVEEICKTANVARSTFYAHFAGKEALQRSGLEQLGEVLSGGGRHQHNTAPLAFSLPLLEHAHGHRDLHRALAGSRGGAIALATIGRILRDQVREELKLHWIKEENIPRALIVEFVAGAYMAVASWWLDGGAKLSPKEIDVMLRRLALEGIGGRLARER